MAKISSITTWARDKKYVLSGLPNILLSAIKYRGN